MPTDTVRVYQQVLEEVYLNYDLLATKDDVLNCEEDMKMLKQSFINRSNSGKTPLFEKIKGPFLP